MAQDEGYGWKVTYRRLTNGWASYSGIKDGMIRYVRAIVTCNHTIAVFQIDYAQSEKVAYDPIILRMVRDRWIRTAVSPNFLEPVSVPAAGTSGSGLGVF